MKKVKRKLHIDGFVKIEFRIIFLLLQKPKLKIRIMILHPISPWRHITKQTFTPYEISFKLCLFTLLEISTFDF